MIERRRQHNSDSVLEEKGRQKHCGGDCCREVKRTQPRRCVGKKKGRHTMGKRRQHNRCGVVEKGGRKQNHVGGGGGGGGGERGKTT